MFLERNMIVGENPKRHLATRPAYCIGVSLSEIGVKMGGSSNQKQIIDRMFDSIEVP